MKTNEPNPLLKEILGGDELTDFRRASLEHGLTALRRQQRRRRHIVRLSALLMVPLLFAFAILSRRAPEVSNQHLAFTNTIGATIATQPEDGRDAKFLTDEELFALFPNRPLALVGKPGRQQLVFLYQATKSRQPAPSPPQRHALSN